LFSKFMILKRVNSLISDLSSIGGFVALFFDLADKKFDDYYTVKLR